MNSDEEKLLKLRNELYEEWIKHRTSTIGDAELMDYLYLYMNELEYVLHGPRGDPDFDPEYQQQLLDEEGLV
tara:strand:- start:29406 stop:29621 length:216 start_codon:yes stop_codon:yes gene_type:complete